MIAMGPAYDIGIRRFNRNVLLRHAGYPVIKRAKMLIPRLTKNVQIDIVNIDTNMESRDSTDMSIPRAQNTTKKTKSSLTRVLKRFATNAIL